MAVVIVYVTESGDSGFAGIFPRKLTEGEWIGWVKENMPEEIYQGDCYAFRTEYQYDGRVEQIPEPEYNIKSL